MMADLLITGWPVAAVVAAVFLAAFYLVNQYHRLPGLTLVFWMRVAVVVVMAPLMLSLDLPRNPDFYGWVLLSVLFGTTADIRMVNVSARFGGGVVARVMPLSVWGAFFVWFLFHPDQIHSYLNQPLLTAGIVLALCGCVFFSQRMNRCALTKSAFILMLPALIGYSLTTVINKQAMMVGVAEARTVGAVYGYMFFQSVFACVLLGLYGQVTQKLDFRWTAIRKHSALLWRGAVFLAAAWLLHMVCKNYAIMYSPHPAYQAALGLLAPVFTALFYRLRRERDPTDPWAGYGVVLSALILALLTTRV